MTLIQDSATNTGHCKALFPKKLGVRLPRVIQAKGCWITDEEGRRYLDASGGSAVCNVGHGVESIQEAVARQLKQVEYVNSMQFSAPSVEELAEALAGYLSPSVPDPRCYFLNTGGDAVEAAVKLAIQYWGERGKSGKNRIVSRAPSYHGASLTCLALSGREHYKVPFRQVLMPSLQVPSPWGEKDIDMAAVEAFLKTVREIGAENIAAFVAEPVGGSSTGAAVPHPDYWPAIREICNQNEILLIADEVMCGMGRTGKWLACEHFSLQPDIVTLGKGVNGGYAPLSAMVAQGYLVETIAQGSGNFMHAGTFSHNPMVCAVGLAVVRYLEENRLVERSASMGEVLHRKLQVLKQHPVIGEIRGVGLFAGVEFLQDPATRTPFPRNRRFAERFVRQAMENGVALWPNVGHVNGEEGDLILLAPPFVITEEEMDFLVEGLMKTLVGMEKDDV